MSGRRCLRHLHVRKSPVVDQEGGRAGGCLSLPAEELGALAAACEGSHCPGGGFSFSLQWSDIAPPHCDVTSLQQSWQIQSYSPFNFTKTPRPSSHHTHLFFKKALLILATFPGKTKLMS